MSQSGSKVDSRDKLLLDALFEEAQATSAADIREDLRADGVDPEQIVAEMRARAHHLVMKSQEARQRANARHEQLALSAEPVVVDRHEKACARERSLSETAAGWYLRSANDEMSSRDRRKFLVWLRRTPENIAELFKIAHLNRQLQRCLPSSSFRSQLADYARKHSTKHRLRLRWTLGAVAALLLVGVLAGQEYIERGRVITTGASEGRNLTLEDGSEVHVEARSSIKVDYTANARIVHVNKGEAVFAVTKDQKRPFVARTQWVDVTAVGTRFAVSIDAGVVITVSEGAVWVTSREHADGPGVVLKAGEGMQVLQGDLTRSRRAQEEAERTFQRARTARLNLGGMTVAEGVKELNRRNRMQIVVESPALAARVIESANVPADEPKTYATAVAAASGVKMEVDEKNGVIRLSD